MISKLKPFLGIVDKFGPASAASPQSKVIIVIVMIKLKLWSTSGCEVKDVVELSFRALFCSPIMPIVFTGEYFLMMIIWVGLCVVFASWITHMYYQDVNCARMKPWMRFIVFELLSRLVCSKKNLDIRSDESNEEIMAVYDTQGYFGEGIQEPVGLDLKSNAKEIDNQRDADKDDHEFTSLEKEMSAIKGNLKAKKAEKKSKELEERNLQEWRRAVAIIDMFLFWLYLFVNILTAMVFTIKSSRIATH